MGTFRNAGKRYKPPQPESPFVPIYGEVLKDTEKAVEVGHPTAGRRTWIARANVENGLLLKVGDANIRVREWVAKKENLTYGKEGE